MEFPSDKNLYNNDEQFMLGDAILVRPVLESKVNKVKVILPGKEVIIIKNIIIHVFLTDLKKLNRRYFNLILNVYF